MPGISALMDSDTENHISYIDENSLISAISDTTSIAQTKVASAKKPRKRKCVTMPKKSRTIKIETTGDSEEPARPTGTKRKAKAIEVAVDEDDLVEVGPTRAKSKSTKVIKDKDATRVGTKATKGRPSKKALAAKSEIEADDSLPSPVNVRSQFASTKTAKSFPKPVTEGKAKSTAGKVSKTVAQITENTVSEPEEEDDDVEMVDVQPARKKARTESRTRQEPSYRRRAGSVSDTERGDPLLRRKLGDMTRKYENVDMKYRNLKEMAVSEANTNFEKLRKEHDTITETTNKLILSLKQQLTQQAPVVQEYQKYKKDGQKNEAESKKLQSSNNELSTSLTAAQSEIKTLKAKLAAAKATPALAVVPAPAPIEARVIQSTQKNGGQLGKSVNGSNNEVVQIQQLQLDLYSDLTGLIIRDVKQTEDGETFDCIQTGRDGRALHFKLFIDQEESKKANHDEQEFLYTPLLDGGRDRALVEIMPSYLTEDITFAREVAARFYGRVVETVMRRAEPSGDEDSE